MNSAHTTIMSSLSALPSPHLSRLTFSLSAVLRSRLRRLSALLSSPDLFSLTLRRLNSLSLRHKSILIARFLLADLALLNRLIYDASSSTSSADLRLRDLDAALLLLLLCEIDRHDRELLDLPLSRWRDALRGYVGGSIFQISRLGGFCSAGGGALLEFVDCVGRCWNLVDVMCVGKEDEDATAASAEAVAALPSVATGGGEECAICREEMVEAGEACELPCRHVFHWPCVLRWLGKRNTCPCCRRLLPSADLRREIERLLEELAEIIGCGSSQCNGI